MIMGECLVHFEAFATYLKELQHQAAAALAELGGGGSEDVFAAHDEVLPYGLSQVRLVEGGSVFERAGIAISLVDGEKLPQSATVRNPHLKDLPFKVAGLSTVLHPRNPHAPTAHANVRLFVVEDPESGQAHWWFGGGMDVTPYLPQEDRSVLWHQQLAAIYEQHGMGDYYAAHKKGCDEYFYLPHRREHRGIGGVFFDDLSQVGMAPMMAWVQALIEHFFQSYGAWVNSAKDLPYDAQARQFQEYRRGRYTEFNLLYDRGTKFGLAFGGRVEAIMMSMPPVAQWHFGVPRGCEAMNAALLAHIKPKDWVGAVVD
jgi:coproporphyrinogen III oxidase